MNDREALRIAHGETPLRPTREESCARMLNAHRNKFALNGSLGLVSHIKRTATVEEAVSLTRNACQILQLGLEIG